MAGTALTREIGPEVPAGHFHVQDEKKVARTVATFTVVIGRSKHRNENVYARMTIVPIQNRTLQDLKSRKRAHLRQKLRSVLLNLALLTTRVHTHQFLLLLLCRALALWLPTTVPVRLSAISLPVPFTTAHTLTVITTVSPSPPVAPSIGLDFAVIKLVPTASWITPRPVESLALLLSLPTFSVVVAHVSWWRRAVSV